MENFSLTLTSEASNEIFPDNVIGNFQNQLPYSLYIPPNFEVGLVELYFKTAYNNVTDATNAVLTNEIEKLGPFTIPEGYYDSAADFIENINTAISGYSFKLLSGGHCRIKAPSATLNANALHLSHSLAGNIASSRYMLSARDVFRKIGTLQ